MGSRPIETCHDIPKSGHEVRSVWMTWTAN